MRLSENTVRHLRTALKGCDPNGVNWFIAALDLKCGVLPHLEKSPPVALHRQRLYDAINSFKDARRHLKHFAGKGGTAPIPQRNFSDTRGNAIPLEHMLESVDKSIDAYVSLGRLIELFEDALEAQPAKKRGQKQTADEDGFVTEIARAYRDYIGEPRSTEGHPFHEVVGIVFEAVGRKTKDPSRAIRAAISSFSDDN